MIGLAAFISLALPSNAWPASKHKEAHSLEREKKDLVSRYKREHKKNPQSDKLSGITLRLHEIQTELDALTGGKGLVEDANAHSRRRRSGMGSLNGNNY